MGCCCSKKLKAEASRGGAKPEARDPPSPEEETIKEVLSETPRPRPRPRARPRVEEEDEAKEEGEEEEEDAKKTGKGKGKEESEEAAGIIGYDERSEETSEAYSVSEGLSASMAAAEKVGAEEEEEAEGRRRRRQEISSASPFPSPSPAKIRRKRSVPGEIAARRDRSVAVSSVGCRSGTAARRAAAAAEGAVARTHSAREAARSRPPSGNGSAIRRDPGERSGRRSVSPAPAKHRLGGQCRAAVAAPAQAAKANGRVSPRRIPLATEEAEAEGGAGDGGGGAGAGKESLENPLVSLECFIFL